MGFLDKAKEEAKEMMGRGKEAAGDVTDNKDLQAEGKQDQAEGKVGQAKEDVKSAAKNIKDDLT